MYLTTKNWHSVHSFVQSGNHSFAPTWRSVRRRRLFRESVIILQPPRRGFSVGGGVLCLVLRHDVTGEDLGIVERQDITPDMICGSVSEDPAVVEAVLRWDRATLSTWRDLVGARDVADRREQNPKGVTCGTL
jgi:hypothetical protein